MRTRGIPSAAAYSPQSAGLEIARTYLTRDGKPIEGNTVPQGTLVVVKFAARATAGPVANVVLENLLPAGLEVENPRLATTGYGKQLQRSLPPLWSTTDPEVVLASLRRLDATLTGAAAPTTGDPT